MPERSVPGEMQYCGHGVPGVQGGGHGGGTHIAFGGQHSGSTIGHAVVVVGLHGGGQGGQVVVVVVGVPVVDGGLHGGGMQPLAVVVVVVVVVVVGGPLEALPPLLVVVPCLCAAFEWCRRWRRPCFVAL